MHRPVLLFKGALPAFVWVEIQASTVEVDRRLEVLDIAKAPSGLLHPLDSGVHGFEAGVGNMVLQVGQDIREVVTDEPGHLRHGPEAAMGGPPEPTREELLGGPPVDVAPEPAEALLERPRPGYAQLAVLQGLECLPLGRSHVFGPHEPEVLGAGESVVIGLAEGAVLGLPHFVDGLMEMLLDVELIEDDLGSRILQVARVDWR